MIKPCPFCGSVATSITEGANVRCSCSNEECPLFSIECSYDKWNKRPGEEELLKVIREIVYSGKEPETIQNKLDNALILLGKYGGENE